MIELYWSIGRTILDRQMSEPWGSKVLDRLVRDLRTEFSHLKGFSRSNLYNVRALAAAGNGPGLNCPDTVWTIELEPQRRAPELAGRP
ncbi:MULTISPECIES: DUF1016 N-terminal domain-containing protein [unclassified Arthrobacter]|uniref:DUF1016 N-terminal domain-containing protein n=1 Tax=unclassified Arthrobacter TaxID=235627 RepID=UPI002E12F257|nr:MULTISPECIES: DUF1016 N-terminal domain-containing protein [unclassified Arthrobacter]